MVVREGRGGGEALGEWAGGSRQMISRRLMSSGGLGGSVLGLCDGCSAAGETVREEIRPRSGLGGILGRGLWWWEATES